MPVRSNKQVKKPLLSLKNTTGLLAEKFLKLRLVISVGRNEDLGDFSQP